MDNKLLSANLLKNDRLSSRVLVLLCLGLFYQLFFVFQGLDFTDTGFHLTAYQRIFDHPETVHYSFMFWLSNIAGGLLMKCSPTLIFNRVVSVFLHSAMFWLYYDLLKRLTSKDKAAIYSLLSLVFFQYYGFETLNYDSFSISGMSLSAYFLIRGLWNSNLRYLILGAFVCGASTYFRITNLSYIVFLPLTLLFDFHEKRNVRNTTVLVLYLSVSYMLGHVLILLSMWILGHLPLFMSNLEFVISMGGAGDSSHGLLPVMLFYAKGLSKVCFVITVLIIFNFIRPFIKRYVSVDLLRGLLLFGVGFCMFFTFQYPDWVWNKQRYLLYALIVLNTVYSIRSQNQSFAILSVFSFLLMIIFPLGSDSGIAKLYFSCGLSLMVLLFNIDHILTHGKWHSIKLILTSFYVFICVCFGLSNTYFDLGSRLHKFTRVDHKYLSYIYTTSERSAEITKLLDELKFHSQAGEYLLAFSDIPMVNFLTETLPYIGTSWPKLYYSPQIFEAELLRAKQQKGNVIIVLQKMEMRSDWPLSNTPEYLDLSKTVDGVHPQNRLPEHYEIMFRYLKNNNYQQVWESNTFRIYWPQ